MREGERTGQPDMMQKSNSHVDTSLKCVDPVCVVCHGQLFILLICRFVYEAFLETHPSNENLPLLR